MKSTSAKMRWQIMRFVLICLLLCWCAVVVRGSDGTDVDGESGELDVDGDGGQSGAADDYGDYGGENETESNGGVGSGGGGKQRTTNVAKRRVGVTYLWGKWDKWSKCNNTCVQIKRRQCIRRIQNDTESEPVDTMFYPQANASSNRPLGCHGVLRRYRLCKDDRCRLPDAGAVMRDEQCAAFRTFIYKERYHKWQGYVLDRDECQLYCRPGSAQDPNEYVAMNQTVINGTPCQRPAVYYTSAFRRTAACVEGICRAVHSSGAIRPITSSDSQLRCGSVLCQTVSELYSKAKLSYGYNYVTTIPAGAMNLTIKQLARSDNLLALKTTDNNFIINGNNRASESGIYEYNQDTYDYNRELSLVKARGPIYKPVVLLLLVHGLNMGVKYDYTLPVASASVGDDDELPTQWNELGQPLDEVDENDIDGTATAQLARAKERKRRKFSWKLLGFGPCNRSCGPGIQAPIFRCIRDSPTRYYSPKRCAFAEKPIFSEDIYQCNLGLCAAYWRAGDYGECRCADGEAEGRRTRYMKCVQEQITGKVATVAESLCGKDEKFPDLVETCSCPNYMRRKIYARDSENPPRVYARLIGAPTSARQVHNSTAPQRRLSRDDRADRAGVWLMSSWHDCSTECGRGFEQRSIYCDRTTPNTNLCDLRHTPEQRRICTGHKDLEHCLLGVWFTSEWSNCTGDCFSLQRRRVVHCLLDGVVVPDAQCASAQRPLELANCTNKEVDFCGPTWHYSDWSECSRSCGDGIQRRYAKCIEYDLKQNALVDSNKCKIIDREPVYGACNARACEEKKRLDAVQGEINGGVRGTHGASVIAANTNANNNIYNNYNLNNNSNNSTSGSEDCSDEFSNCKRINRQRLCKLPYYKTYCCIACTGYY